MSDGEQRKRQIEIETGHRAAVAAKAEVVHDVAGEDTRGDDQRERRSTDRAPHDGKQAGAVFSIGRLCPVAAAADLQHFGTGHAFRIGQIGIGHQRTAQRNRIHDAEDAAERADRERSPVGKSGPPADHDQARQHEDDRRQGAGRRRDRLHDVVFLDRRVLEAAQQRHRDDGGRNRRRKGQAGLEAEEDVGGGEHDGDDDAQNQTAQGQFGARFCARIFGAGI